MSKDHKDSGALVSIGMPVYNGAAHIRRALDSLLAQSFSDFEIIISDNASTDATKEICLDYVNRDSRIRYIRQESNISVLPNFDFVLNASCGDYFMWAAHDDEWDSRYIEKMLHVFEGSDASVVAVASEAQYTIDGEKQVPFAEAKAYYQFHGDSVYERACHILKYNYGNQFYSLYRREVLFSDGQSNLSRLQAKSLNEVPFFLQVIAHGNWRVVPEFLFYKHTNVATWVQAKWEMEGGVLPVGSLRSYVGLFFYSLKYHLLAVRDIARAIKMLKLRVMPRIILQCKSLLRLWIHFLFLNIHYKPGNSL